VDSNSISWMKWLGVAVAGLLAVFLAVGLLLPGSYEVERSVLIAAPQEVISARVDDLRRRELQQQGSDAGQGSITWEREADQIRVFWRDQGKLPPVVGGYLRPTVERSRGAELQLGLDRLKTLVENEHRAPAEAR
jgi:hypothetical protein